MNRTWGLVHEIFYLNAIGKGDETMMICSPNDPMETYPELIHAWVNDKYCPDVVFSERLKHPVKTVGEWCEYYKALGW